MIDGYEVLIVGGGPAGLSAAMILGRCNRRVLLCDNGKPRNAASGAVHGLLGHHGKSPGELLALGRRELEALPTIESRSTEIVSIEAHDDEFAFAAADGSRGTARKVLLATGLIDELPPIPGVEDYYGRSVHHCLYCDGFEYSGLPLAAYGVGDKGAGLALMMRHWSGDIALFTDGQAPSEPQQLRLAAAGVRIIAGPIAGMEGSGGCLQAIRLQSGEAIARTALFFSTGCRQSSHLSKTLNCARDEKGGIAIDPLTEETSVRGVYVAGDVSRDVLLVAVAIAEGAKAAVAINRSLLKAEGLLT
jgi:thioredoxin reductase